MEGGGVAFLSNEKFTKVKPIETVHDGLASWRSFKLNASTRALVKSGEDMCFAFIQQMCLRRDFEQRERLRSSIHWDVPGLRAKEVLNAEVVTLLGRNILLLVWLPCAERTHDTKMPYLKDARYLGHHEMHIDLPNSDPRLTALLLPKRRLTRRLMRRLARRLTRGRRRWRSG